MEFIDLCSYCFVSHRLHSIFRIDRLVWRTNCQDYVVRDSSYRMRHVTINHIDLARFSWIYFAVICNSTPTSYNDQQVVARMSVRDETFTRMDVDDIRAQKAIAYSSLAGCTAVRHPKWARLQTDSKQLFVVY